MPEKYVIGKFELQNITDSVFSVLWMEWVDESINDHKGTGSTG